MKRIIFFLIILTIVVRAHGKAAPAVAATSSTANDSIAANGISSKAGVANPAPEVASRTEDQTGLGLGGAVLNISEPISLTLLGLTLILFVSITRRLPNYLRQKQIRLRHAWHVVSGFFF